MKPTAAADAKPTEQTENPKAVELKKQIESEKNSRLSLIIGAKRLRHKLAYKQAEFETFSKLNEMNKEKPRNIGYLKRQKEKLEFRIATEASTLNSEKELIRKIKAIDEDLEKALKSYKVKRKVELVAGDIEELKKEIDAQEEKIKVSNLKLDELYSALRALSGHRQKQVRHEPHHERTKAISLEDIAIMKEAKGSDEESSYIDTN